ncbi:MAG: serine protease, partial [Rectinemataceae bacterium]|nr:serine protease [Rectinemataceae bacterium]
LAKRYNSLCEAEKAKGAFVCSSLPVDAIVRTQASSEDAVFVIEWAGDYQIPGLNDIEAVCCQGTAFAYKDVGLITCNHVLGFSGEIKGKHVETDISSSDVINVQLKISNPSTGESWNAKVIHRDAHRDLAIVRFDHPDPPEHHHFIGMEQPIQVGSSGILIGFPNHTAGKRANFLNEKVLNRFPRSALERIEITGSIRQGNSGGLFVDEHYRVAGVAQQGARQDCGNDECLCVSVLDAWLSEYKSTFSAGNNSSEVVAAIVNGS